MKVSPDDPRSVRTRQLLLEAMVRLAAERSVATLTVGDVTQEAGIYRSTFYLHYSGIPELFEDCSKELFQQLRNDIFAMSSSGTWRAMPQIIPYVTVVFHHIVPGRNIRTDPGARHT